MVAAHTVKWLWAATILHSRHAINLVEGGGMQSTEYLMRNGNIFHGLRMKYYLFQISAFQTHPSCRMNTQNVIKKLLALQNRRNQKGKKKKDEEKTTLPTCK